MADVPEIVEATLKRGEVVERLLYREPGGDRACRTASAIPFYRKQRRLVLEKCGVIDPESIEEYIATDGYLAATKACIEMEPEDICDILLESGLRGRGGGGFPTGENGTRPGSRTTKRNTSYATVTRGTRAPSWTWASWRGTPTAS